MISHLAAVFFLHLLLILLFTFLKILISHQATIVSTCSHPLLRVNFGGAIFLGKNELRVFRGATAAMLLRATAVLKHERDFFVFLQLILLKCRVSCRFQHIVPIEVFKVAIITTLEGFVSFRPHLLVL